MTLLDAADFLNISERSMRRLQQSGQIRYFKVGGRVQFAVGDLRAHLATCERPAVNQ